MRKKVTQNPNNTFASKIQAVGELAPYLKILVYGRSGTGKTTFIGSCPKPLLVLDIREQGTTSIRQSSESFVVSIESWEDFEDAYWFLDSEEGKKYKTVAIDTVTPLQELALKKVIGKEGGVISRRSWGEASSLMKTWIMLYRDLPTNVIFTAQDRESSTEDIEDEGTILPEVGPYLMPSVAKILAAAVGVIGNTYIREREKKVKVGTKSTTKTVVEYCMRVGPHARYLTKLRRDPSLSGPLPPTLVNPSFEEMLALSIGDNVKE